MDYNKPGISYGVANFNSSMQEINADIDSTEMIDGLMQWVEQYTNVLHEISVAETLDDLKELKQNAASPDVRPCRTIVSGSTPTEAVRSSRFSPI